MVILLCGVLLCGVLTTGQVDVAGTNPLPGSVVGVSHTEHTVDDYPHEQVRAPMSLLTSHPMVQNQYLMGWGADNPEPAPGVYDWTSLDERMALIEATHGVAVLTLAGVNLVIMVNVAVVVETVFAWPGIGRLLYEGISFRDFPVVQGVVLMGGAMIVVVNLLIDILYAVIDPRIRLGS